MIQAKTDNLDKKKSLHHLLLPDKKASSGQRFFFNCIHHLLLLRNQSPPISDHSPLTLIWNCKRKKGTLSSSSSLFLGFLHLRFLPGRLSMQVETNH